jgi:hypothetical protein
MSIDENFGPQQGKSHLTSERYLPKKIHRPALDKSFQVPYSRAQ